MKKLTAAAILAVLTTPVYAVSKCVDAEGHITYKSGPCVGELEYGQANEHTFSSVNGTRNAADQLRAIRSLSEQPRYTQSYQPRPDTRPSWGERRATKNNNKKARRAFESGNRDVGRMYQRENAAIRNQPYNPDIEQTIIVLP